MGIIYKANFPNGKCYIGQTKNELNTRIIQHKSDSKYNTTNIPFYNAIKKYGFDNIIWEIIDEAESPEELDVKEIYWIEKCRSYIHFENSMGYNATLGGESSSIFTVLNDEQLKKLGEDYLKNNLSKKEIAEKYQIPYFKAARICNGHLWSHYTKIKPKDDDVPVHSLITKKQVDEIIKVFKECGSCKKTSRIVSLSYGATRNVIKGITWSEYTKIFNDDFYNEYKKYSKWTKKQILEIANLYLQGKKIDEIANIVSFSIDRKDIVEITGGRKFQSITNLPRTHRRKNI